MCFSFNNMQVPTLRPQSSTSLLAEKKIIFKTQAKTALGSKKKNSSFVTVWEKEINQAS